MSLTDGKRAAFEAALSVLDRVRQTPRGWKGTELRQHLWREITRHVGQATTTDFCRDIQHGYDHICARHLFPPTDTFYPGDSDYTHQQVTADMRRD
jgi:hypothetical protein